VKGKPRRMWFDDFKEWAMLIDYEEEEFNAEDHDT